jgi:biotin operon repressor
MRHHDFSGIATKQVAAMLGVEVQCVNNHMRQMKKIAPQLFPILTRRQSEVYELYVEMNLSGNAVSELLGIARPTVQSKLDEIKRKGLHVPKRAKRIVRYSCWMDSKVTYKF